MRPELDVHVAELRRRLACVAKAIAALEKLVIIREPQGPQDSQTDQRRAGKDKMAPKGWVDGFQ